MIYNALNISHEVLKKYIKPGQSVIDATAGNGGDTLLLCELVGKSGKVLAFDIQNAAVKNTEKKVCEAGFSDICKVVLDSHENMENYAEPESINAVVFNFGWLPGGDHDIHTLAASSVAAVKSALKLLKPGGLISLCIYYGKNNGYGEKDALLQLISELDFKKYTVMKIDFSNRINDPPFPVFIIKEA